MTIDRRYKTVGHLITDGRITTFNQIWDHIPKSVVFKRLGMNYQRFARLVHNPALFVIKDLIAMAGFFGIDAKIILDMAYNQIVENRGKKKK